MATVTKRWCQWADDTGFVEYTYDDTVSSGFPHGKLTGFNWTNPSSTPEILRMTLEPGVTGAVLSAGVVSSIPLAAGSPVPFLSGEPVVVAGVTFAINSNAAVGATSISVTPQSIASSIPSGTPVECPLPEISIPAAGQQGNLPAFFGGQAINSSQSIGVSNLGIPMQTLTGHGGTTLTVPPATLGCAGD